MFCGACGHNNSDTANFCIACGVRLAPGPAPASPLGVAAPPPMQQPPVRRAAPHPAPRPANPALYAGFWKRLAAFLLDTVLITAGAFAVVFVFALTGLSFAKGGGGELLFNLVAFLASWLYYALMESSGRQATLGKMALGLKVVDEEGAPISFGRATGRYFGKILSSLTLCIGYLIIAFTRRKQGLHDMVASTLVVNAAAMDSAQAGDWEGSGSSGMRGWQIALIVVAVGFVPLVGILAAIAIPAYQDYVVRARLMQAHAASQRMAEQVVSRYQSTGKVPTDPTTLGVALTPNVTFALDRGAIIATDRSTQAAFVLEPQEKDGQVVWRCRRLEGRVGLLPAACRAE